MNRTVTLFMLLALGSSLGITLALTAPAPSAHAPVEWLSQPRSLAHFHRLSREGRSDNDITEGRWTIVLFGFLHCPDICPTSLSQLAGLIEDLPDRTRADLAFVFVTVDPGRDSKAEVSGYARHFHPSILGVAIDDLHLTELTNNLGIQFSVDDNPSDYTVSHSITYSIIDPSGRLRGRFRPGFDSPALAKELALKVSDSTQPI